jgi:hypothetical protein
MRNSNTKKDKEKLIKYSQAEHFAKLKCQVNFGFCANPKFTLQKNFNTAIRTPLSSCYAQPSNLAFHNTSHPYHHTNISTFSFGKYTFPISTLK